jgi:hypothetical protein
MNSDRSPARIHIRRLAALCVVAVSLCVATGCAGYQFGNQTLYRPDVRTIHVPIFQSNSFRKDFGERLTEAVVKQIVDKTPYVITCEADAESILSGQILSERKTVLAEDVNDVPRNIGTDLVVRIRWESRSGDLLRDNLGALPPILYVSQTANAIPEGGQSIATAQQRAITQLAEQIVSQLEYPW